MSIKTVQVDKELLRRWRIRAFRAAKYDRNVDFKEYLTSMWVTGYTGNVAPAFPGPMSCKSSVRIPDLPAGMYNPPGSHNSTSYLEGLFVSSQVPVPLRDWPVQMNLKVPPDVKELWEELPTRLKSLGVHRPLWLKGVVSALWEHRDLWMDGEMQQERWVAGRTETAEVVNERPPAEVEWALKIFSLVSKTPVKHLYATGVRLESALTTGDWRDYEDKVEFDWNELRENCMNNYEVPLGYC